MIERQKILSVIKDTLIGKALTASPVEDIDGKLALQLDSVGRLTLLVELENEFDVELLDDEFDPASMESIKTFCDYVERKVKNK